MGLSNKLATKARTAPKTSPANLPKPWHDCGYLSANAIVRAAVTTIGQLGLKSSGFTGNDAFGLNSSKLAAASTIWAHQDSPGTWLIGLGKDTTSGPVYDWHMRLAITSNGLTGQQAAVETLNYITRDGTLLNKDSFGELRSLLLTNLADGRAPTGTAERKTADTSLPAATIRPHSQRPTNVLISDTLKTTLTTQQILDLLPLVPFTRDPATTGYAWQLLPGESSAMTMDITDTDGQRHLHFTAQLTPTGQLVRDCRTADRANVLPRTVLRLILAADPEARLTRTNGPA